MSKRHQKIKSNERESEPEIWSYDVLEYSRKRRICVVVHPIRADTKLATGLRDTDPKSLLGIRKFERAILGHEGTVDVVDVVGVLVVGEQGVENCNGSAVYEEADPVPEGAMRPVAEIGVRLNEEHVRLRDVVYVFIAGTTGVAVHVPSALSDAASARAYEDRTQNRC